jgi:hypothetical protein
MSDITVAVEKDMGCVDFEDNVAISALIGA